MNILNNLNGSAKSTGMMPVLFVGHGSPMNAIEDTEFSRKWQELGQSIPRPQAILCVSAHWETCGTQITAMDRPPTIHDFGGFPEELFQVEYPAAGNPSLVDSIQKTLPEEKIKKDLNWGLDHGCWSIIRHMYPKADIPVIQLSLDYSRDPKRHYQLAKELSWLREKGVLVVGSGNIVHNLRKVDWYHPDRGYDWAIEANHKIKELVEKGDHDSLIQFEKLGEEIKLAVPTPEHYLPLLYFTGMLRQTESISVFNDKTIMGSLSMTSFISV